jgi:hypothetical protein
LGFFYTQQLLDQLSIGADLNSKPLKMHLMSHAPQMDGDDERLALKAVTDLPSLVAQAGWESVSSVNYAPMTTTPLVVANGTNRYLKLNTSLVPTPTNMEPSQVEAVVYTMTAAALGLGGPDRVLFGTTTPFPERVVFRGGDGISARIDTTINERWLFGWAGTGGVVSSIIEGTTVIQQGAPPYETSRIHHAWVTPQRVNYIANPSWEGGITHWQTNMGPMTRVLANNSFPSPWLGHALGPNPSGVLPEYHPELRLYLRSNEFYPRGQEFTFQFLARGTGTVRVGLSYYPRDYSEHAMDWGQLDSLIFEEWILDPMTFTHVRGLRRMSEGYEGALLIEVRDDTTAPEIYIDKALLEEGTLLDWQYFDGDSTYGADDDFSWYGYANLADKRGKSYSMWYNNRRSIAGRLFGRRLDDTALYTSADEQLDSLVSQWTPAGAVVVPHWDVLYEDDQQQAPQDHSTEILPVESWPEQTQFFRIVSISAVTASSATVVVVGEGEFPVTGGHISSGAVSAALTIVREVIPLVVEDLYDTTKPQTLYVTWTENAGLIEPTTLYLERDAP